MKMYHVVVGVGLRPSFEAGKGTFLMKALFISSEAKNEGSPYPFSVNR